MSHRTPRGSDREDRGQRISLAVGRDGDFVVIGVGEDVVRMTPESVRKLVATLVKAADAVEAADRALAVASEGIGAIKRRKGWRK